MIQPAASTYTADNDAITTPVPIAPVPLESLAPVAPANDAVRKRRIWPWVALGGVAVFALAFSLTFTVGFVTSAEEIDAAVNALGVMAGAVFVGFCGGGVTMWCFVQTRRAE